MFRLSQQKRITGFRILQKYHLVLFIMRERLFWGLEIQGRLKTCYSDFTLLLKTFFLFLISCYGADNMDT